MYFLLRTGTWRRQCGIVSNIRRHTKYLRGLVIYKVTVLRQIRIGDTTSKIEMSCWIQNTVTLTTSEQGKATTKFEELQQKIDGGLHIWAFINSLGQRDEVKDHLPTW